jgi:hypothetical protein
VQAGASWGLQHLAVTASLDNKFGLRDEDRLFCELASIAEPFSE